MGEGRGGEGRGGEARADLSLELDTIPRGRMRVSGYAELEFSGAQRGGTLQSTHRHTDTHTHTSTHAYDTRLGLLTYGKLVGLNSVVVIERPRHARHLKHLVHLRHNFGWRCQRGSLGTRSVFFKKL